jgi:hypothetical protein
VSGLRIDYSDLRGLVAEVRGGRGRRLALEAGRVVAFWLFAAVLPFVLLIRGGVVAYSAWDVGTWPSLALAAIATASLLGIYASWACHRLRTGGGPRRLFVRGAFGIALAYVAYTLVFIASANVKSEDVRAEYRAMHPLLRVASSALILVDPESIVTDAGRTRQDYRRMGLTPIEASLHFRQDDGYVHALDLRTKGRSELRNRAIQIAFWALGFHTLRHVGTADHLHVSLRMPG